MRFSKIERRIILYLTISDYSRATLVMLKILFMLVHNRYHPDITETKLMPAETLSINEAQIILSDYGNLLSNTQPSVYGLPESLLPHDKSVIKSAIKCLLESEELSEAKIRNSLIEAYVFLAHFISDYDAQLIDNIQQNWESSSLENIDLEKSQSANRIVNSIKLEMERLLNEVELIQRTRQFKD